MRGAEVRGAVAELLVERVERRVRGLRVELGLAVVALEAGNGERHHGDDVIARGLPDRRGLGRAGSVAAAGDEIAAGPVCVESVDPEVEVRLPEAVDRDLNAAEETVVETVRDVHGQLVEIAAGGRIGFLVAPEAAVGVAGRVAA